MTAEGTFPKIAGDVIYASEVNKFASRLYATTGSTASFNSGTAIQTLGSFIIPGGTLTSPSLIDFRFRLTNIAKPVIRCSGASANNAYTGVSFFDKPVGRVQFYTGSPWYGWIFSEVGQSNAGGESVDAHSETCIEFDNLNTGSPVVIIMQATISASTAAYYYYCTADGVRY
jgi:hypothetical protein